MRGEGEVVRARHDGRLRTALVRHLDHETRGARVRDDTAAVLSMLLLVMVVGIEACLPREDLPLMVLLSVEARLSREELLLMLLLLARETHVPPSSFACPRSRPGAGIGTLWKGVRVVEAGGDGGL